jgi:hypothetical protein
VARLHAVGRRSARLDGRPASVGTGGSRHGFGVAAPAGGATGLVVLVVG